MPERVGLSLRPSRKNLSSLHNPKILYIFAATDSATLPIRTANQGGTSFLYTFMNYTKQPLDYHQIISQLKSRGLLFHNEDVAISQLQIISYFRIANYLKSFEVVGFSRKGGKRDDAYNVRLGGKDVHGAVVKSRDYVKAR